MPSVSITLLLAKLAICRYGNCKWTEQQDIPGNLCNVLYVYKIKEYNWQICFT